MVTEPVYTISGEYQQIINAVRDGILRWLNRAGNEYWYLNFAASTASAMYARKIPDQLFERMEAAHWLCHGGFGQQVGSMEIVDLWDEAVYQVAARLCLDDEGVFRE
ncbi:MAG: hypothetical protein E6Q97_07180 [Desulfurellales bacterium]|nr:MAG: hypothetical protein E6Q97_07180 [Desulfurellales bacterium]